MVRQVQRRRAMSVRSARLVPVVLLGAVAACAPPPAGGSSGERDGHDEQVQFGLGGKADGGLCDPAAELCWPTRHGRAMRGLMRAQDGLVLGTGQAGPQARTMVDALDALAVKLTREELEALEPLRARAEAMEADAAPAVRRRFVSELHDRVAARIATGYLAAHSVPLGASTSEGKADAAGSLPSTEGLSEGMRESLALLREQGIFGYGYALMLEHTGVLERDYPTLTETFSFSEPREQRVQRIIEEYTWRAAGAASVAAAEGLIPYAGLVLSMAHGSLMQFRLRARMVLEIAAVYGMDVREGHNLLVAVGAMMGAFELTDVRATVAAATAVPVLSWAVLEYGGAASVHALIRQMMWELLEGLLARVSTKGAELAARLGGRAAARAAGRQILGWATFGLAIVADVTLTTVTTRKVGKHADAMLRPWGSGMLVEGAPFLADSGAADCAALVLGDAMGADGRVTDEERQLLAAHLDRFVYRDGEWARMSPAEHDVRVGAELAAASASGQRDALREAERCVDDHFRGTDRPVRLTLLSWFYTAAAIDGRIEPAERQRYGRLLEQLRGDAWFGDGKELDEGYLEALRGRVGTLLAPGEDVGADVERAVRELPRERLVDRLAAPHPRGTDAVAAAFGS